MYNFSAGRIFTRRELSSRRECYQDFASRQDSRRDPREEFFSWRDPGEYRFLVGILAEIRGGNFSREGSRRENGPPRRDPAGERRESWRDPGEIPVPRVGLEILYFCTPANISDDLTILGELICQNAKCIIEVTQF